MKAIQVSFDEKLLRQLDSTEEVRARGRSAVLREAASEYLRRRRELEITERFKKAYSDGEALGEEFGGWEEQGSWPES